MKLIIFAALVAFAAARPQEEIEYVAIIREDSVPIEGANFRHEFEADNGLSQSMVGSADENGAQVMTGSYSFPLPDGSIATFNWVADALGFRVESPLLPVAVAAEHPVPAHAQEQIDFANAQQAAGLAWDQAVHAWI
ncbi:unnamed protein product [Meganyctiphanes norvegica]|uniref:Uncharacterized protein n=1 Tax=Meganyctiphanes norvegica TaxID=48144 RepID=A0AAV2Q604_MEGNR